MSPTTHARRQRLGISPIHGALVVFAAIAVFVAHALYFWHIFGDVAIDDAYISFRYAENLSRGHGLVFNPGERVEGYSNFLWVLALALITHIASDLTAPARILGLVLGIATLGLAASAVRRVFRLGGAGAMAAAVLVPAASGYFAAWCISGMESALYALILLAAWVRYAVESERPDDRHAGSALLFVALALTRAEGVLLALVAVAFHGVRLACERPRRPATRALVFPAIVVAAIGFYEIWRFAYYGPYLLPNSVQAKLGGGIHQLLRGSDYVARNFLVPYAPLLLCILLLRRRWRETASALGVLLVVAYLCVFAAAGGDWSSGRFFAPLLPLASVLFVGTLARLGASTGAWRSRGGRATLTLLMAIFIAASFHITTNVRKAPRWRTYAAADHERVSIGRWLAQTMPADARLAAFALGQLAYYSKLYTHDMLGLTDRHIAALEMPNLGKGTPGHEKYDPAYTLETIRPDIIIGASLIPVMTRTKTYMTEYQPVRHFWQQHDVVLRHDFVVRLSKHATEPGGAEDP